MINCIRLVNSSPNRPVSSSPSNTFRHFNAFKILVVFFSFLHFDVTNGDLVVVSPGNRTVDVFIDLELSFSASINYDGIIGKVIMSSPSENGCDPVDRPPTLPDNATSKWFLLVKRYPCTFQKQVKNAIEAGYDAIIIYNVELDNFRKHTSSVRFPSADNSASIPGVLISADDGWAIRKSYLYDKGYSVMLLPDLPFNINAYLLPFAIVIGICLLLMISFMIIKCLRDRRRSRRHRLSSRHLKQIPTTKYKKGDQYDTCAICLEEYTEGEKLRVLPCAHVYHVKCIDPWLTKSRRVCPVCKGKVVLPGMSDMSDSEEEREENQTGATERTPLLDDNRSRNRRRRSGRENGPSTSGSEGGSISSNLRVNVEDREISVIEEEGEDVSGYYSPPAVEQDLSVDLPSNYHSVNTTSRERTESVIEVASESSLSNARVQLSQSRSQQEGRSPRRQDVIV